MYFKSQIKDYLRTVKKKKKSINTNQILYHHYIVHSESRVLCAQLLQETFKQFGPTLS